MTKKLPDASSSFTVETGVTTNRVREKRALREKRTRRSNPAAPIGQYGRTDLGSRTRVVCISLDAADLEEIDRRSSAIGLSRSGFLVRSALGRL